MRLPRRRLLFGILAVTLVAAVVLTLPFTLTPGVRARLTDALSERFDSDVELETLRVSVLPRVRVDGARVALRHKGRTDVPPLIAIASFSAEANLFGLLGRPLRLRRVHLEGLEINVPPGSVDIDDEDDAREKGGSRLPPPPPPPPPPSTEADEGAAAPRSPLIVDDLLSERAVLRILRGDPGKPPRVFEISRLTMRDAGSNAPWAFKATLRNPTPPGEIDTEGTFGPWQAARPAETRLKAAYRFRQANLGVFGGIRGILHSTGAFEGVLRRIEVAGRTDVPEFALDGVGHPVHLTTRFQAVVDGTTGNTWLRPVDARLGDSPIRADGGVIERPGEKGRTVALDVTMSGARIEDVLRLAVQSPTPPMTGALTLKTSFELPPGEADTLERLRLDGSFEIETARFATRNIQEKVEELSKKARGEPEEPPDRVVSDLRGRFVMKNGVIHFSSITFTVPGASVNLAGRYTVRSEALDFRGTVRLDAKLSELTTGVKSFLLKLVDPLMRRKDVTVVPVTVGGTAKDPDFGLDVRRAFTAK